MDKDSKKHSSEPWSLFWILSYSVEYSHSLSGNVIYYCVEHSDMKSTIATAKRKAALEEIQLTSVSKQLNLEYLEFVINESMLLINNPIWFS